MASLKRKGHPLEAAEIAEVRALLHDRGEKETCVLLNGISSTTLYRALSGVGLYQTTASGIRAALKDIREGKVAVA